MQKRNDEKVSQCLERIFTSQAVQREVLTMRRLVEDEAIWEGAKAAAEPMRVARATIRFILV
jgi:hypothetical protein